jgi:predicted phage gp36 major capsid-like protein
VHPGALTQQLWNLQLGAREATDGPVARRVDQSRRGSKAADRELCHSAANGSEWLRRVGDSEEVRLASQRRSAARSGYLATTELSQSALRQ